MKLWKSTTIALLASVISLPTIGMEGGEISKKSPRTVKSSKMPKKQESVNLRYMAD